MPEELGVGRHVLVPKHEILPKKEVDKVLERYKIQLHQLPLIRNTDPAAREIGAKSGDVLKITRISQTAGEAIIYRYVIEG